MGEWVEGALRPRVLSLAARASASGWTRLQAGDAAVCAMGSAAGAPAHSSSGRRSSGAAAMSFHARRAGRPEVHRRPVPRPGVLQRADRRRGRDADPGLADAPVFSTVMGLGTSVGGEQHHQVRRSWTWSSSRSTRASPRTSRSALCLLLIDRARHPRDHHAHQDQRHHGRRRGAAACPAINFGVVRDMVLTWVFTFPGCGIISYVMAKLFMLVF